MNRRRFLGAVGAGLGLAGCLSRGTGPGGSDDPTPTGTGPGTSPSEPGDPSDALDMGVIGEGPGSVNPHALTVHNDGDTSRHVELRITDVEEGYTLLDQSYTLPADGRIAGSLLGPAEYEVRVAVPDAGTEHVTTVDHFDTCNDYGTDVTIDPDGSVSSQGFTTEEDCDPTPTAATATPAEDPTDTATPSGAFSIGEPTGEFNPHGLTLLNEGEETRTVDLRIADAAADETLLEQSYTLASGERVDGTIEPLGTYEVRVALPETGAEHVTTVDYFDVCNSYGTDVTIDADGSISSQTWQTLAACPPSGTPPSEPFAVGETTDEVNPHGLTVRNDSAVGLSVAVHVTDAETDETLLDETYALGSDEAVEGELRGPAGYDVRVEAVEAGTEHVTAVDYFDTCNDYGTTVTIAPDASLSSETITTDMECGA